MKDKFGGPLHFRVGRVAKVVMYFAEVVVGSKYNINRGVAFVTGRIFLT